MSKIFEDIVAWSDRSGQIRSPISEEEYELWKRDFTLDALRGQRYGQSFCNRFSVSDNILYYSTWPNEQMDNYIKKNYIERA